MSSVNPADILKLLSLVGEVALTAKKGYDEARALAQKAGVSEGDMDKADARFARVFTDPLKQGPQAPTPSPTTDPYATQYDVDPKTSASIASLFQPNDIRWKLASGKFIVSRHGIGTGEASIPGITRLGTFSED